MNSDNVVQLLQKGFRVTLGATATLIEVLQDSQKRDESLTKFQTELSQLMATLPNPQTRDENLTRLQTEWGYLSEEWAEKGAVTEQEARSFVDNLMAKQGSSATGATSSAASTATVPTAPPDIQSELQELTAQIAAIRSELEKLRTPDSSV